MEQVLLSLVIAVYNTSKSLDACMESVLKQDLQNMEIICVDDGSTDDSYAILQRYAERDQRIRIIQHERNQGLLKARRTGVEAARGVFIQFLDSDDALDPGLCSCVVDLIRKNQTDILQFSTRINYLETGKKDVIEPVPERYEGTDVLKNFFVTASVSTSIWIKIYRTEICKKAFSAIPDIRCYVGEDILASFFIAYFASSYVGVKTKAKYVYSFGSGVSSEMKMPLKKFQQYCEMSRFPKIISDFLDSEMADGLQRKALKHMIYRLVSDCCINYTRVDEADKDAAAEMLWQNWIDNPEFPKALMLAYETQITELRNSASYRLGNAVASRLHNFKRIIN